MTKALIRRNRLQLQEEDGSPIGRPATLKMTNGSPIGRPATLKMTNGSLTDNSDNTFSLAVGGAGATQSSKTADFAIAASGYFDNIGAAAAISGTFAATPGIEAIIARVAAFEVSIKPASGKQIIWNEVRLAVDEALVIATGLGTITCVVNPDGDVQVLAWLGDVQEDSP